MSTSEWHAGVPTEPGLYAVDLGGGQRPILVHWAEGQRDWRDGAVRVPVRRWHGPLPPIPRTVRPEARAKR
ncbi:hypothetical protein ACFFGH_06530 [Lysobacter korlensis]|uniref:Uncharacterized protein n=1 Tax=Lysobacter korlensis TaxID=553636 RepID=A0ABV6RKJ7_9GAMM